MQQPSTPWPHAPIHQLSDRATYFVTASTYNKENHFRNRQKLSVLHRGLLTLAHKYEWNLHAWAVFSNHYHFVAASPSTLPDATNLSQMLGELHTKTAAWINRLDKTPHRKVWHNFWETKLTHQKSYFARLNYTHQNPVKHRLVLVANQYTWCSAAWFERTASPAIIKSIYRFNTDRLNVIDEFDPVLDE
jgi:putative transposase